MARKLIDYFRKEDFTKDYELEKLYIKDISEVDDTKPVDGSEPQKFYTLTLQRDNSDKNNATANIIEFKKTVFEHTHPGVFKYVEKLIADGIDYTAKGVYVEAKVIVLNSKKQYYFQIDGKYRVFPTDTDDHKKGDKIPARKHLFILFRDVDTLEGFATRRMNQIGKDWIEVDDSGTDELVSTEN